MINLNGEERFFFLKKKDTALDEILHSGTSKYFHLSEALQHEQFEKKKKDFVDRNDRSNAIHCITA